MKITILTLALVLFCTGCSGVEKKNNGAKVTDSLGNTVYVPKNARVVSCYDSFSECWLLSGGELVGVTEDAITEHKLKVGENTDVIGSVKAPNLEKIISLDPDYIIFSADLTAHLALKESLDNLNIPYGYFRVDTFNDYKALMRQFCTVNEREDLFKSKVLAVEDKILEIKSKIPKNDYSFLLLRAYATGVKAKTDDNLAGIILKEMGLINIAEKDKSILEDLSYEHIIKSEPDYIFVLTMGNEDTALSFFEANFLKNPAFAELSAVKDQKYYILPKELFHYKPNDRWSESYEYIARLIWPSVFTK